MAMRIEWEIISHECFLASSTFTRPTSIFLLVRLFLIVQVIMRFLHLDHYGHEDIGESGQNSRGIQIVLQDIPHEHWQAE